MTRNSTIAVAGLFAGLALVHGAQRVSAGDAAATHLAKPLEGFALNVGPKRAFGHYLPQNGACALSVAVADAFDDTADVAKLVPVRITTSVRAGTSVEVDTPSGQVINFTCAADAKTLSVRPLTRLAYAAPAK
jgi:hypothetical protein